MLIVKTPERSQPESPYMTILAEQIKPKGRPIPDGLYAGEWVETKVRTRAYDIDFEFETWFGYDAQMPSPCTITVKDGQVIITTEV